MSHVREVLEEVKTQRLTAARIDELKEPWHTPFWSLLAQVPWIAFFLWSTFRDETPRSWFGVVCVLLFGALSIIGVVGAIKSRDRMWRDVIKREAPSLHKRLSDKNA